MHSIAEEERNTVKKLVALVLALTIGLTFCGCYIRSFGFIPDPYTYIDSNLTPVAEPESGAILFGEEVIDGSKITICAASSNACVVKLKDLSDSDCMSFYVRAGDTVTVDVPREYLYVYFASGNIWYGEKDLFGSATSYQKDDAIKDFISYAWEFKLYPVSDGNLTLKKIDKDNF